MKKYFSISLSLGVLFLISTTLQAQSPVARVTQVSGDVFVSDGSSMRKVQAGQHLFDLAELTTAVGASVAFNDFHDHVYHLAGQGQVKLMNRTIELRRGYFWIQSLGQHNQGFQVVTANARVQYAKGQGVISYSPETSRTQFMAIDGHYRFGSMLQPDLDLTVRPGQFSFVDREYNHGAPRHATSIGQGTFSQVMALFPTMKVNRAQVETEFVVEAAPAQAPRAATSGSRAPASVNTSVDHSRKAPGVTIFVPLERNGELKAKREKFISELSKEVPTKAASRTSRAPASVSSTPSAAQRTPPKGNVPVHVFGQKISVKTQTPSAVQRSTPSPVERIVQQAQQRAPASVRSSESDPFEKALEREYRQQQRHSDEVNALIRDLKNYNMDYREGF